MKLICERDALAGSLSHVSRRAEHKSKIPILQQVLLKTDANKLSLTATDLYTRSVVTTLAEISSGGATTVSADRLARLVDGLPQGAQIAVEMKGSDLHIVCGKSRYKLPTLPAADFPEMSGVTDGVVIPLKAAEAKRLFGEPAPAVSTETSRFYLCGGHLSQATKGRVIVTATNGISLVRAAIPSTVKLERGYIIPRPAMAEIVKLAALGDITLRVSQTQVEAEAGNVVFTSKLIDATFPDADRVIPLPQTTFITLGRSEFCAAFKRLVGIAEDNSTIDIRWKPGDATIEMALSGSGSGTESVACECDLAAEGEIAFQPHILGEMIDVLDGEIVQLHITGAGSPMLIVDPADADLTVVAMPCKPRNG
jgi:DNA polymerase III subunit beta